MGHDEKQALTRPVPICLRFAVIRVRREGQRDANPVDTTTVYDSCRSRQADAAGLSTISTIGQPYIFAKHRPMPASAELSLGMGLLF